MSPSEFQEKAQQLSYANAVTFHNPERSFPNQVFEGCWETFLFFQSDYLFSAEFVRVAHEIMLCEQAQSVCFINLDQTDPKYPGLAAAIYITQDMDPATYTNKLADGGPACGWLYSMDRYICTSDVGGWCVYCEKDSDIAVAALNGDSASLGNCFQHVFAEPIAGLLREDAPNRFPFSNLLPDWRKKLLDNYAGPLSL